MVLALIPARGGSKGVPGKNIKMIHGRPLIAWTIMRAKEAHTIDRIIVSTDSENIANVAKEYGAEVLIRPPELATDTASSLDVMIHALQNYPADTLVLLQPTSPYRSKGLIDRCVEEFQANDYDSLATGFVCDYKEYGTNSLPRQQIKGFFYDDGNVYVIKGENILHGDRFGEHVGYYYTDRFENAEIDEPFDFWLLEEILKKKDLEGEL